MQRHVFKWPFPLGTDRIQVPVGKVVLVGTQDPSDPMPTAWIEHKEDNGVKMELVMFGTGHDISSMSLEHVGSCVCAYGNLVWHVYRVF